MFHIVPKMLWQKKIECDVQNRIPAALNSLYLEIEGKKILIESCAGNKFNSKLQNIFKRDGSSPLFQALETEGIDRQSIDMVLLSHLHQDHAGSLSYFSQDKKIDSVFHRHST